MAKKTIYEDLEQKISELEKKISEHRYAEKMLIISYNEQKRQTEQQIAELTKANNDLKKRLEDCKQTEAALRKSNGRYKGIFEFTKNSIAVYEAINDGEDFMFVDLNTSAEHMENLKREEVIGKSVLEIFPKFRSFGLFQVFQRVWETGKTEYHPISMYEDEQRKGWRENFVYKLPSGEIIAIYNDKTDQKQAEDALRKSEAQKKAILDGITINLAFVDETLSILWTNKAAEKSVSKFPEKMLGHKCYELWADSKKICNNCPTARAFKTKKTEVSIMCMPDGRVWHEKAEPVFDESEKMIGVVQIAKDITDKIRLQAHLQQAHKMEAIASLARGIAHEFNNALFGVTGNLELLKIASAGNQKTDKYIHSMSHSVRRMTRLTEQLTAYAHGGKYQPKTISLSDFVEDTLPLIRHTVNPSVSITTELDKDIPNVNVDVHQMEMILSAVISNSAEAIDGKGHIHILIAKEDYDEEYKKFPSGSDPQGYACLIIKDTGKGMDEETKCRIFEPFFTTKKKFHGRGLSMAAVYGIINDHDGRISVESEVGKGTEVYICLPIVN
ncbi:PAS domain-containing sensor histidine kinase [Desulfonema magnum]|uniref:histidine kinase n=1 Tax=Desulfonema magnum TaxID=45655 RepID=A0A975GR72_9BACT|nr:PAS domain-containing sensor histidine kinase [Desulfonema magnum]QTA90674.1 Two component system histidine kinase, PAS domain-containing [Desulfonema magnum]